MMRRLVPLDPLRPGHATPVGRGGKGVPSLLAQQAGDFTRRKEMIRAGNAGP